MFHHHSSRPHDSKLVEFHNTHLFLPDNEDLHLFHKNENNNGSPKIHIWEINDWIQVFVPQDKCWTFSRYGHKATSQSKQPEWCFKRNNWNMTTSVYVSTYVGQYEPTSLFSGVCNTLLRNKQTTTGSGQKEAATLTSLRTKSKTTQKYSDKPRVA